VPFTRSIRVGETGAANFGLIFLMGLGVAGLVGAHTLLCLHPIALWSGIVVSAVGLVAFWRRLRGLKASADRRLLVPHTRLVVE
jgi:hypothetical protein